MFLTRMSTKTSIKETEAFKPRISQKHVQNFLNIEQFVQIRETKYTRGIHCQLGSLTANKSFSQNNRLNKRNNLSNMGIAMKVVT